MENISNITSEIVALFDLAKQKFPDELSHKLVKKARNLAQSKRIRLSSELRRQYCHNCYHLLVPTKNCTVRLQKSCVVYSCQDCGHHNRYRFS